MRYCGVSVGPELHHLCALEEVRDPEPPIRLAATFYEPGSAQRVVEALRSLGEVVVAIAAPTTPPADGRELRYCDVELRQRGVPPGRPLEAAAALRHGLAELGFFSGDPALLEGPVPEGAYHDTPAFETNPDAVFFALQERRLPAKRHPLGIERRIEELVEDHVVDEGGELWHRRIEEIEAAAAALCAHRYAVGHARWVGDPAEGVVVLPGSGPLQPFSARGVLPPVERPPLPVRAGVDT
jgi:predicted nuclease with RNAse H fold